MRRFALGDLIMTSRSYNRIGLRPGFGRAATDELDSFMFKVLPGELGIIVNVDPRGPFEPRFHVAFRAGIDTTAEAADLRLVAAVGR